MNKFCHNCGKQLPVVAGMKFCPFCNTSLLSLSSTPVVQAQAQAPVSSFPPFSVGGDEDEDYIDRMHGYRPKVNKLDVEIRTFQPPAETVGAVAEQGVNGGSVDENLRRPAPFANFSAQQIQQEFAKEAGSLKRE